MMEGMAIAMVTAMEVVAVHLVVANQVIGFAVVVAICNLLGIHHVANAALLRQVLAVTQEIEAVEVVDA